QGLLELPGTFLSAEIVDDDVGAFADEQRRSSRAESAGSAGEKDRASAQWSRVELESEPAVAPGEGFVEIFRGHGLLNCFPGEVRSLPRAALRHLSPGWDSSCKLGSLRHGTPISR